MSYQSPHGQPEQSDRFADGTYLLKTWTGRIVILCSIIYLPMALLTGSFISTNASFFNLLYLLGAKETVALANGEWWRLISPVFLHFNLIHFFLNMAALKFIGRIVERNVGAFWFLTIFFLSGINGNLWSALGNTAMGAGASGAIFGLIGTMILIEYTAEFQRYKAGKEIQISGDIIDISDEEGKKFKIVPGPFTVMGLLNIALAIVINTIASISDSASFGIDNAAHMGGLTAGLVLGLAFLLVHKTRLIKQNLLIGRILFLSVIIFAIAQSYYIFNSSHLKDLLLTDARAEPTAQRSLHLYGRALEITPEDPFVHFNIGRILVLAGHPKEALKHLSFAAQNQSLIQAFNELEEQLASENRPDLRNLIREIRSEAKGFPL